MTCCSEPESSSLPMLPLYVLSRPFGGPEDLSRFMYSSPLKESSHSSDAGRSAKTLGENQIEMALFAKRYGYRGGRRSCSIEASRALSPRTLGDMRQRLWRDTLLLYTGLGVVTVT